VTEYAARAPGDVLAAEFARVRTELGVPAGFPEAVLAEAAATAHEPAPHDTDATALPLVTIDPPGSMDLDQALLVERRGAGYRVTYAIADVAAVVRAGGAVDAEAHARGTTYYSPDLRTPLHPPTLSEGVASLLPDAVRPALLWRIDLDEHGEHVDVDVARALVRSVARLDYPSVQRSLDDGTASEPLMLLRDVGRKRQDLAAGRGAVNLRTPEQEVERSADGTWTLRYRAQLPVEDWNAEISLLTGMCAAQLMLDAGVGILRTLPPPDERAVASLRRSALALGVDWPDSERYADVIRRLDPAVPVDAAVLRLATRLLRGAAYTVVGTTGEQLEHSGIAAPYAHVTAPLRRLVDRYAGECCVALCAGVPVPDWVRAGLDVLPQVMREADRRSHGLERATVDVAEAAVLAPHVGQEFDATVVEVDRSPDTRTEHGQQGEVQLRDPAVRAECTGGPLELGATIRVRLVTADIHERRVTFTAGQT